MEAGIEGSITDLTKANREQEEQQEGKTTGPQFLL